jgi:hypothetical protein
MPRAASSWPARAGASGVASGSRTVSPTVSNPASDPRTRATYRMLTFRGLAPAEAANLTAFLCGLPVGEAHWSIAEVNRLLFLRELNRTGRFGSEDGSTPTD